MTDRPEDQESPMDPMRGFFGSLAVALVVSNLVGFLIVWAGGSPDVAQVIDTALFFGIIFSNPVGAYMQEGSVRDMARQFLVGALGGVVVVGLIHFAMPDVAPGDSTPEGTEVTAPGSEATEPAEEKNTTGIFLKLMAFSLLILPIMFLLPTLDRYLKGRDNPELAAKEDLQISLVFPLWMTLSMALTFFVMGALWMLEAPVIVGFGLLVVVVLLAITEVWTAEEDELPDLEDGEWGDRPETARDAWVGLKKAVRPTITSSLFLGTTVYLTLQAALPYMDFEVIDGDVDVGGLLFGLFAGMGIMLIGFFVILALTVALIAAMALLLARMKGADPLSMVALAQQTQARLLMGGIRHVRPDQMDD